MPGSNNSNANTHVLILRNPKDESDNNQSVTFNKPDPYEVAFTLALLRSSSSSTSTTSTTSTSNTNTTNTTTSTFTGVVPRVVTTVPIYETAYTLAELEWILETGPTFHGYAGVVATSRRAVEAWAEAARNVRVRRGSEDEDGGVGGANWNDIPLYVVGEATAKTARTLLSRSNTYTSNIPHQLTPGVILGGAEATNAERLAYFIRRHVEERARVTVIASRSTLTLGIPPGNKRGLEDVDVDDGATVSSSHGYEASVDTHASTDGLLPAQTAESRSYDTKWPEGASSSTEKTTTTTVAPPLAATKTKLLYLVGDKTRDVLPLILDKGNPGRGAAKKLSKGAVTVDGSSEEGEGLVTVEVDAVQVYETRPSKGIGVAIDAAVRAYPNVNSWWIATFAPSGADAAFPYLRQHFSLPEIGGITDNSAGLFSSSTSPSASNSGKNVDNGKIKKKKKEANVDSTTVKRPKARIAAIGPTTAAHLRNVLKLEVAAVAKEPTPEALAKAVEGVEVGIVGP